MKTPEHDFRAYFLLSFFGIVSIYFGYAIQRTDLISLLTAISLLFAAFYGLYVSAHSPSTVRLALLGALLIRLSLMFMSPNLSDDYIRFIWDGQLILNHISPYSFTPQEIITHPSVAFPLKESLYERLNDLQRSNTSCYLPLNQLFFVLPVFFFPNDITASMVLMRLTFLLAEVGTALFGLKILARMNLPQKHILLYALNPLVIFELTGNLHFEAIMIFFLVAGLYFMLSSRLYLSALFVGLAISMKLAPIILVPAFFRYLGLKKWLIFSSLAGVICLLLFSPVFVFNGSEGFFNSLNLYFQSFEFNASLYYLARTIGYAITGYNAIAVIGPLMTGLALILFLLFSLNSANKNQSTLISSLVLIYASFYFLATTVHPWYMTTLVALSIFTPFRFPILWSATIFLSYHAYSTDGFSENMMLLSLEYGVVFGWLVYELKRQAPSSALFSKFN